MSAWKPLQIPKGQTVTLVQQPVDRIGYGRIAEEGGNELAEPSGSSPPEKPPGSIRICALSRLTDKCLAALGNIGGGQVLQNPAHAGHRLHGGRHGPCRTRSWCRGDRNDDPRRCQAHGGSHALVGGAVMLKDAGTNSPALR